MQPRLHCLSEGATISNSWISEQIRAFLELHNPVRVVVTQSIIGCRHEEGIDYPEGQPCPRCPFWEGRDRWTGLMVN